MDPDNDQAAATPTPGAQPYSGADEQLLAELRARTAQLASQVGSQSPPSRVLQIDDSTVAEDLIEEAFDEQSAHDDHKKPDNHSTEDPAVELVRKKLAKIYGKEPEAALEVLEAEASPAKKRTKHQEFMHTLTNSGKTLAEIQTAWHNYYTLLPDNEKHDVWQEFYDTQKAMTEAAVQAIQLPEYHQRKATPAAKKPEPSEARTVGAIKDQIYSKVSAGGKLSAGQHFKSLLFGVGLATLVAAIITFVFFNEAFIAPFVSPAKTVSTTPILGESEAVGPESKIIIPKINLEVPVVFDMTTVDESAVQKSLEDGVVHYASTPNPGEIGNSVIVGHSSNNILNKGKYKFAFVLLKRLESEDIFFVQRGGVRYTYKIYKKEIVSPDQTEILNTQDRPNTMTLVTCDPPGTSINRLIVVGEQISPDPVSNVASTAPVIEETAATLPSNSPSLWSRIWPF